MKKTILTILICLIGYAASAQIFSGEYTTELEWNGGDRVNWMNLLRLNLNVPLWKGSEFQASTLHMAGVGDAVLDEWQVFSNIYEENRVATIAVLGLWQELDITDRFRADLFLGVRNMDEDFFDGECTSLFTNSSEGIFPTISANMPVPTYPASALNFHFALHYGGWTLKNSIFNGVAYTGWRHDDNPFIARFGRDGIFNITELSYEWDLGAYYAGFAAHSRTFTFDSDFELCDPADARHKANWTWYVHGQETVYTTKNDNRLMVMAQFSENAYRYAACRLYAQLGTVYAYGDDQLGLAARYCKYQPGDEWSVEGTWYKQINRTFAVQPAVSYIKNDVYGNMAGVIARLYVNF